MFAHVCSPRGVRWLAAGVVSLLAAASLTASDKVEKPKLSLRASPSVGFSPARIVVTAELKGGANDYEEYYCARVEWQWGDETMSENSYDCDPYEPGKSEIRRRFVTEHLYRTAGAFQIEFRLKRRDKLLAAARTTVQIRPGVRDIGH